MMKDNRNYQKRKIKMTTGKELIEKGKNLKQGECTDVEIDAGGKKKITMQMCRTEGKLILKGKK